MTQSYEKQTKDSVDFPAYNLCFLNAILSKLEMYGLIEGKKSQIGAEPPSILVIPIISRKFKYCFDGIELIEKTLKRRGFNCSMTKYKALEGDKEGYSYEFKISKI